MKNNKKKVTMIDSNFDAAWRLKMMKFEKEEIIFMFGIIAKENLKLRYEKRN